MIFVPDSYLETLLEEDVPSIDLTTLALGIGESRGQIEYYTREACLLCCTEEAVRIMEKLGLEVVSFKPSGTQLEAQESFLVARGRADALHAAWKVCLNLFDRYSAMATKTKGMVDSVHAVNPMMPVLATRKCIPGVKLLTTKAIVCGGAYPHRLGLSETILVFKHHMEFMGGFDAFVAELPQIMPRVCEKKLFVEADAEQAEVLVQAGVDGIQFDKLTVDELNAIVPVLRAINPRITLVAAGGIRPENAASYAATGVDGLVTTSLFTAKPLDMSVHMSRLA